VIVLSALAVPASAAGPNAIVDLPGCTTNTLPANDDSSTSAVPIGFTASFFGAPYTQLFVNNNGNVTFDSALGEYTPFDFSTSGNVIVAPFLADVDTTAGAVVTYGETTFDGQPAFCVNWRDVGYYGGHTDKLNAFQLLLVKRGDAGAFDIIFNYDQVQWETGDASDGNGGIGGTSAAWGFANGDGEDAHYFVGPGSLANGALLDGGPSALIAGSRGTTQLGRYIFPVSEAGSTGPKLSGEVTADGSPVAFAPLQICPTGGGACATRTTNSSGHYQAFGLSGSYNLTAFPPSGSSRSPGHAGPVTINAADVTQDIALGPNPAAPPPDTTITSISTNPDGIPVAYWNDPLTLTTQGCPGGSANYELRVRGNLERSGSMAEGPPGGYTATIAPLAPVSGDGVVHISITCPTPADNEAFDFGIYIDPSGLVRDSLGAPVSGATVVLWRSGTPDGTFAPVPDGSALMAPSNRTNPDQTSADGRFGWDVVAGYYKVRATKDGCVSNANRASSFAESAVLTIPPPVTDLDLRLYCGEGGGDGPTTPPVTNPSPPVTNPPPPVTNPPSGGSSVTPDRTVPGMTAALSPARFRVGAAATAISASTRRRAPAPVGTRITLGLSENARVTIRIERLLPGVRVRRNCLAPRLGRRGTRCTRAILAGTLTRALRRGSTRVPFSGRIGRRALPAGSYRAVLRATDAAGNNSRTRTLGFTVVVN
jgi:hypothetical protein